MVRSLRKGSSSVYLQYPDDGDSIGADTFEAEITKDVVILRFRLRPVDSNQAEDENNLHEFDLLSVMIDDEYIIDNLSKFLKYHPASSMKLEIVSKGKVLIFNVKPDAEEIGQLYLMVERNSV